jgi:prepilin-type N-terminal cleavage/methylation domain-containing protein
VRRLTSTSEDGFTLAELIVAMAIIGMLSLLGIGAYLHARSTADATSNRQRLDSAYHVISRCKSENDGFYASYADLKGSYCLSSLTVQGDTKLCNIGASGSDSCAAPGGSRCWDTAATSSASAAHALLASPSSDYTSGDEHGHRVGLCTFNGLTGSATTAATENASDSQYVRVSLHRNGHIYYSVDEPNGLRSYVGKDSDNDGVVDSGSCLRLTGGSSRATPTNCGA